MGPASSKTRLSYRTPRSAKASVAGPRDGRPPAKSWTISCLSGLVVACGFTLMVAGCATESKRQLLTFFFDGVPPLATNAPAAEAMAPAKQDGTNATAAPIFVKVTSGPHILLHQPFGDNQCGECHESKFSQKLKGKVDELCFNCHDNFLEVAKFKHNPAETGDCLSCHDAHQSEVKGLLTKRDPAICMDCHEEEDLLKVKEHNNRVDLACLPCHDPHGGADKFYLKKVVAKVAMSEPAPAPATAKGEQVK